MCITTPINLVSKRTSKPARMSSNSSSSPIPPRPATNGATKRGRKRSAPCHSAPRRRTTCYAASGLIAPVRNHRLDDGLRAQELTDAEVVDQSHQQPDVD